MRLLCNSTELPDATCFTEMKESCLLMTLVTEHPCQQPLQDPSFTYETMETMTGTNTLRVLLRNVRACNDCTQYNIRAQNRVHFNEPTTTTISSEAMDIGNVIIELSLEVRKMAFNFLSLSNVLLCSKSNADPNVMRNITDATRYAASLFRILGQMSIPLGQSPPRFINFRHN